MFPKLFSCLFILYIIYIVQSATLPVLKYSMLLVYITAVMSNPCHNQQLSTVPHPHNCNTFIVCWMSQLYFQACPIGSLFDTVTNNCQPWPVAQCCNVEKPNSRHPLPSTDSIGTLVTRVLSTEKNTFSTKLLPDDVTIHSTKFPFTEQQIPTKNTDSADNKIIFKEKTTTVTPEIKGYTFSTSRTTIGASEIPIVNNHTLTSAAIQTTKHNLSPAVTTTPTEEPCWICSTETEEDSAETTTAKKDSETTQTLNTKIPSDVTENYTLTTKRQLTSTHMSTENEVIEASTSRKPIETLPPVTPTSLTSGASEQTSDVSVESTTFKLTSITDINSKVTEPKTATGTLATFSTSRTTIGASEIPIVNNHTLTSAAIETTKHNLSPAVTTTPTEEPCWICSTETEEDSAETTTAKKDSEATQTLNTKISSDVTVNYTLTTKCPLTSTHMSTENEVIEASTSRKPIETLPPVTPTLLTSGASEQTSDVSVESTTSKLTSITDINSKVTEPKTATGTLATFSTSRTTIGASEIPIVNNHTLTSAAIQTTKHNLSPAVTTTPTEEETTTAKKDSETTQTLNTKIPSDVTENYTLTTKRQLTSTHMSTENEVIEASTSRKPIETLPPVTPTLLTSGASEQTSDVSIESTTSKLTSITDINSKVTEPKTATGTLATFSTSRTTIGASEIPIVNNHTFTSAAIETTKPNLSPAVTTTPTEEPCWICSTETEEDSAETTTAKKDSETTQTLNTKIPSDVTVNYTLTTKRPLTSTHMSTENEVIEASTSRKPIETLPPVTPTSLTSGASEQTSDVSVESTTSKLTSITDINSKVTEPKTATGTLATFSTSRTTIGASEIPIVNNHTLTSAAIQTTKHNLSPAVTTTPTEEETTTAKKDSETTQTLNTKIPSDVTENYTLTTKRQLTSTHMSTENEVIEASTSRKPIETLPPVTPTLLTSGASEQTSDVSVESTTSKLTSITDINSKVTEPKTATGTLATFSTSRTTIEASEIPIVNNHTLTSAAIETTKHNLSPAVTTTPTEEPCWICSTETEEDSAETTTAKNDSEATQTLNTKIPSDVTVNYTLTTKRPLTSTHMSTENEVFEASTSRKPIETLPPVTPTLLTSGASEQTSDVSVESTTSKLTSITDINSKVTEPKTATGTLATFSTSRTTIGASEIPIVNNHTLTSAAIQTTKHNLSPAVTTTPTEEETTTAKKDSETTQTLNTKIPSDVTENYTLTTKRQLTSTHMSTENEVIEASTSRKPIETLPPVTPTSLTSGASEQTSDVSVESTTSKLTSITDINSKVTEPKTATGTLATFSTSRTTIGASEIPIVNNHTLTSAAIQTTKHNLSPAVTTTPTEEPCWICSTETEEDSAKTTRAKNDSEATQTLNTKIPSDVTVNYTLTTKRPLTSTHMSTENEVIEASTSRKPIETLPPVTPTLLTSGASEQTSDVSVESTTSKLTSITDINSKVTEPKTATGTLATFSTSRTTIGASEIPIVNNHTLTSAAIQTTKHNLSPAVTTTPTEEETTTAKKDSETTQTLNTKIPSDVTENYTLTTKRQLTSTHMSTENEVIEASTSRKPIETLPPVTPTSLTSGASEQTSDVSVESTTSKLTSITDINSKVTEPKTATGTLATFSTSRTTIGASEIPIVNNHTLTSAAIQTTKHNLSPAVTTTPTEEPCWICSTETEEDSAETTTAKKDSEATQTLNTKIPSDVTVNYTLTTKRPLTSTHMSTENEVIEASTSRKPIETLPPVTPTLLTSGASEQTSDVSVESTTSKLTSITDINSKVTEPKTATGTLATFSTSRTTIGASEIPIVNNHTLTSAAIQTTKHNLSPAVTTTPTEEETTTAKKDSETTQTLNTKIPSDVTENYTLTTKRQLTSTHMSTENEVIEASTSRKPIETLPPVTPTLLSSGASEQTSDVSVESTTSKLTSITDINSKVTEPKTATGTLATFSTSRTTIGASEIPIVNNHTLTSAAIETTKHNLSPAVTTTPTEEPCWICSTETEEDSAETTTAKKDSETTQTLNTKIPSDVTENYSLTTKRQLTSTHMSTENEVIEASTSRKPIETLPPLTPTLLTTGASEQTSEVSVESTTSKLTSITDINSKVTEPKTATGTLATFSTSRTTIEASEIPIVNNHTLTSAAIETTKHILSPAVTTTPTEEPCWICSTETEEDSAETTTAKKDSETTQTLNTKIPSDVTENYTLTTKRQLTSTHISTENEVIEASTSRKPIETLPPVTPTLLTSGASEQTSDVSVESTTSKLTSITDINSKVTEPKTATGTLATFSTSGTTSGASEIPIVNNHTLTSAAIATTKHNPSPPCPYYATQNTSTTTESPTELQLPDCHTNDKYFYPDLLNCNFYFKCSNGVMERMNCKPNFGFNPHLMKCVPEDSAKCGEYRSTADQKLYLVTFMLFHHIVENKQIELNKDEVESYLR